VNKPEALRLADELIRWDFAITRGRAAAELRRLQGLDFALRNCEQALKNMATKYMDTVDQRNTLLEALKELTPPMPPTDAPCHVGLVPQEKCAHCGRIARARAAIKAVEETK
jgi:hypothetical protein